MAGHRAATLAVLNSRPRASGDYIFVGPTGSGKVGTLALALALPVALALLIGLGPGGFAPGQIVVLRLVLRLLVSMRPLTAAWNDELECIANTASGIVDSEPQGFDSYNSFKSHWASLRV